MEFLFARKALLNTWFLLEMGKLVNRNHVNALKKKKETEREREREAA